MLSSLEFMKKLALLFAIGGIILCVIFGYLAMAGEITGKTFFYDEHLNSGSTPRNRDGFVSVLRDKSPVEFRRGNNFFWAVSGFSIIAAGIGIYFFRDIDDND
jgi:hypothetical protein